MRKFILTILLAMLLSRVAYSKEKGTYLIAENKSLKGVVWSNDSQHLVFSMEASTRSVDLVDGKWMNYDLTAKNLMSGVRWPLQPDLSRDELERWNVAQRIDDQLSFIYSSPDDRFLVYSSTEGSFSIPGPLTLADRSTMRKFVDLNRLTDPFSGPDEFWVLWSENNQAFGVRSSSFRFGFNLVYYVSDFNDKVTNASLISLNRVEISNRSFFVNDIWDISSDGKQLLLDGGEINPKTHEIEGHHLLLWDAEDSNNNQILDTKFEPMASSFCPDNETTILYMDNKTELYTHSLTTSDENHLNTYLDGGWIEAKFAPNGSAIAFVQRRDESSSEGKLYVVDFTEEKFESNHCFG